MTESEAPLAMYSERRFEGQRQFSLFEDRLTVSGKELMGNSYEGELELKELSSDVDTIEERSKYFRIGIVWVMFSLVFNRALVHLADFSWGDAAVSITAATAFVGVVICLATLRKIAYLRVNDSEGIPVLEIARPRGRAQDYEDFTEQLRGRLGAAGGSIASE